MKNDTTVIYFVRHGAVKNPRDVIYGLLPDFPLSKQGELQAEKIGQKLSKEEIKAIYSSPLLRTKQTAEIIKKHFPNLNIIESKLIQEWDAKKWEGKPRDRISKKESNIYNNNAKELNIGESFFQVLKRMQKFTKQALEKHKGGEIICISHCDPIKIIANSLLGKDINEFRKLHCHFTAGFKLIFDKNGKISKVEYIN